MRGLMVVCSLLVATASTPALGRAGLPVEAPRLRTVDGRALELAAPSAGTAATVLVFIATDCPISNRYAPEITRLQTTFASQSVRFVLVYPDPHEDEASIRAHLARYAYTADAVHDPDHQLVRYTEATIAPQAVVLDRDGRRVYSGRIDDRAVQIGVMRQTASRRDLEDALSSVLAGRPVAEATTQAVGCFLADFKP